MQLCDQGCVTHDTHSAVGTMLDCHRRIVSGMIHMSLVEEESEASEIVRGELVHVLKTSAIPRVATIPPAAGSSILVQREAFLDLFLPSWVKKTAAQRMKVEACFNTNMMGASIDVFIPDNVDSDTAVDSWARRAARSLYPCAHRVFSRHRWCKGHTVFSSFGLLLAHDLLQRVGVRFMHRMGKKVGPGAPVSLGFCEESWDDPQRPAREPEGRKAKNARPRGTHQEQGAAGSVS